MGISSAVYKIGEEVCFQAEPAFRKVITNVARTEDVPEGPLVKVDLALVPKFVDFGLTTGSFMGKGQELLIVLEWTAFGRNGKPVWVQTVRGTAQGNAGNTRFSAEKNKKAMIGAAVEDVYAKTIELIASSPELGKLVKAK